jgi:hypothetical protein
LISGKVVVTSDHGNYVGERASPIPIREYGHPRGLYDRPVVCVPWLVRESDDRRRIITSSRDDQAQDINENVVTERLRNLGYTQ